MTFLVTHTSYGLFKLCVAINQQRVANQEYDYYDQQNNEFAYTLITNSLDASVIKNLDKYSPETDDNGFLYFAALMATEGPATKAAARRLVTEFQQLSFSKYLKEDADAYLNDVKKKLSLLG